VQVAQQETFDAVIVGSGPNGLAAALSLAQQGASVLVLEASDEIGGGTRTAELTEPGFAHDVCSAVHTMGILSPFFRTLPLERHGLEWIQPPASLAHPLDDGPAVMLWRSLERTGEGLGDDARAYRAMLEPLLRNPHGFLADALGPLGLPRHPILFARFGLNALWPARWLAKARFRGERARALLAGCAGHSVLPLDKFMTGALGLMFLLCGHVEEWPVAAGGSSAIPRALASLLAEHGGHEPRSARLDLRAGPSGGLSAAAAPLSLRPGCLQARLGTRRPDPVARSELPRGVDGPRRRDARRDQRQRGRDVRRPPRRAAVPDPVPAEPVRPEPRARGSADGLRLLSRTGELGRRHDRRDRVAGRALRAGLSRSHPRAPRDAHRRLRRLQPELRRRRHHGRRRRPVPAVHAPGGEAQPVHPAATPPGGGVHGMCGEHAARSALARLERFEPAPLC
jgi:hypothetical protein